MADDSAEDRPLVVLADDNEDILRVVERRLTRRGYDVVVARDGSAALELIQNRRPDAAILDWVMPKLQGHEVCRRVREDERTVVARTPLILLTARAGEQDIVGGFDAGADEYLTKPFDIDELDEVLRRLVPGA